jgi:glycosyltransferase involved in cell wall biosynthesis
VKVLVLSNLYPPHFVGGYELQTRDGVEGLRARGHTVRVLTSTYGVARPTDDGHVHRCLRFRWSARPPVSDLLHRVPPELQDRDKLSHELRTFAPEAVLVTNLLGLFRSLPECASEQGARIIYDVSDHWFQEFAEGKAVFWSQVPESLFKRLPKRWLEAAFRLRGVPVSPALPQVDKAFFRSGMLKRRCAESGMPVSGAPVIYYGVPMDRFSRTPRDYSRATGKLLYVGRLIENKGAHVLVAACAELARKNAGFELALVGRGEEGYLRRLRADVDRFGLSQRVRWIESWPHEQMPDLFAKHDVLVFPSLWEEPFGNTRLEAMAAGMPIATTLTGGAAEVVTPGEDCLAYPKDDPLALAEVIARLLGDPGLCERLGRSAQANARRRFELSRMIDEVEAFLQRVIHLS